eukprot:TRINITY_DN1145_c0_g1_i5.p1 TRINITY_DN1145_c0_g1~~TRINITY_DN1145_c0_g1_i5.p1  ORF type:complete len:503 (-),score=116.97 TRINITY_DN1145_c0_g1_i5:163-1536(-)
MESVNLEIRDYWRNQLLTLIKTELADYEHIPTGTKRKRESYDRDSEYGSRKVARTPESDPRSEDRDTIKERIDVETNGSHLSHEDIERETEREREREREREKETPKRSHSPVDTTNNENHKVQLSLPTDESNCIRKDDWIVGFHPSAPKTLSIDLEHTLVHSSVVCCVRFSKDGKYLATGCNKSAQIYDAKTGNKVHVFADEKVKDGDLYIRSVCFSPDGKYLAAGADKTVKVWDIDEKSIKHTFVGHELDIYTLDFSSDGRFIASGSGDKKAKIWDMESTDEKCVHTLGDDKNGPGDGITSVAISPDGRYVAAGSLDRIIRLWDTQTGQFIAQYEGHLDSVYSVAFSPDGKYLATGSLDKTIKLWDLLESSSIGCRSTFSGHKDFVLSVAFSPDGSWLVSGSKDRSVQFWDPRTASTHLMLQGHKNSVISVAVSQTGFATGSGDQQARLWSYAQTN